MEAERCRGRQPEALVSALPSGVVADARLKLWVSRAPEERGDARKEGWRTRSAERCRGRRIAGTWPPGGDVHTTAGNGEVQAAYPAQNGHFFAGGAGRPRFASLVLAAECSDSWQPASPSYGLSRSAVSPDQDARRRLRDDVRCDQRGIEEHAQERGRGRGQATMPVQSAQAHD